MNPILRTLRAYALDAREAFRLAPLEVMLGVVVAAAFSVQLRVDDDQWQNWGRLLAAAWLSFTPLLAITCLALRGAIGRHTRVAASALVLVAAWSYAWTVFDPELGAEMWRFACLMLAGIFFLLLTPAIPPRTGDRLAHWKFAFGILARTGGVAAYAGVLLLSLCGAVAAVVNLFELDQPDHLYQDLGAWILLAGAPWILVGGVARLLEESVRPRDGAPVLVVRFGRFLYAPIVVLYLGIVYAYGIRVLVSGELPKNLVSPLVLGAGLFGMAGALLLEPVHADREVRGLSLLVRWVPALLLPILPFAYAAILMRQGQYGWTEFRYLRLAGTIMLTVVAVLGAVWLARRRMPPLASVPGILALGLLMVSVGPWSAQAVSRRDQQARLRAAMREVGLAAPVQLVVQRDSVTVTAEQAERLRGLVQYLVSSHGAGAAAKVLGADALKMQSGWEMAQRLPLRAGCPATPDWTVTADLPSGTLVPVPAGRLAAIRFGRYAAVPQGQVTVRTEGTRLIVRQPGWSAGADLAPLIRGLRPSAGQHCTMDGLRTVPLSTEGGHFPLRDAAGRVRGELFLTELELQHRGAAPDRGLLITRGAGYLVLH